MNNGFSSEFYHFFESCSIEFQWVLYQTLFIHLITALIKNILTVFVDISQLKNFSSNIDLSKPILMNSELFLT